MNSAITITITHTDVDGVTANTAVITTCDLPRHSGEEVEAWVTPFGLSDAQLFAIVEIVKDGTQ